MLVEEVKENEDGSANIELELTEEEVNNFVSIGVQEVLKRAILAEEEEWLQDNITSLQGIFEQLLLHFQTLDTKDEEYQLFNQITSELADILDGVN